MIDFFEELDDYRISTQFFECERNFTVEELYQAFKQRMMVEFQEEMNTAQQQLAKKLESEIYR